jgi:hypothetical protein
MEILLRVMLNEMKETKYWLVLDAKTFSKIGKVKYGLSVRIWVSRNVMYLADESWAS